MISTESNKARWSYRGQFLLTTVMAVFICVIVLPSATGQGTKAEPAKEKQTTLGLYLTAKEAYEKWKADPDKVKIIDVRTPEEYIFVGHPEMAWNIPLSFQTYEWDEEKKRFAMKPNPEFTKQVKEVFKTDDIILVTCRSGGRSATAVDQLAKAGFKNVYSITDGMEGDIVNDPESVFAGQRLKNGWKNSGIPYTYKIDPKLMLIPDTK